MTIDAPKRRGRPPIAEEERKAGNLTFRTRGSLRAQLEEAAQQSGRSVSEEIEHRLQISFDRRSIAMHMYGEKNTGLMEALNYVLNSTRWLPGSRDATACLAAVTTLLAFAKRDYASLVSDVEDPSVWLFLSQLGISRACELDAEAARDEAERLVPEMSEPRVAAGAAAHSKKAKPK
jgi:hypothetical protein